MVEKGKHISNKKKWILRPFSKEVQSNLKNQLFQIIFSMAMTCGREKIAFNYMGFCQAPFIKVCNLETRQKRRFSPFFPLQGNKKKH
jgi:hypothetical protein